MSENPIAENTNVSCPTVLKALADESRFEVVQLLMEGPLLFKDLLAALKIEQSLLSHHLRLLRSSGIVTSERKGKSVLYSLSPGVESQRQGQSLNLGCCQLSFSGTRSE